MFVDPIRPPDDGVSTAEASLNGIPYDIDPRKWIDTLTQAAYHVRMYAQCLRMGIERQIVQPSEGDTYFELGPVPVYLRTAE